MIYAPLWANFDNALIADEKTPNDETAATYLPSAPLARDIEYSSANGRAVGLNAPGTMTATSSVGTGTFDGIVTLNSNQPFDFDRTDGIAAGKYDAVRMIEHEIDEVLGLGSILPSTTDFRGGTALRPEDLFRYAAAGTRSLTSASGASAYFSIDGGQTDIIAFNQLGSGDYGDWSSPACANPHPEFAQYAFTCRGGTADVTWDSPEGIALDVIGYDLVSPEPGTFVFVITGVGAMMMAVRRRRNASNTSEV